MTTSARPFIAARVEKRLDSWLQVVFRSRNWQDRIFGYTGYGTTNQVRIQGRVLLAPPQTNNPLTRAAEDFLARRGWRNFMTAVAPNRPVTITVGEKRVPTTADRGGYIDVLVPDHGLEPGWHTATLRSLSSKPVEIPIVIVGDDVTSGLVSDIDDTVLTTWLPRPLLAAWNSFVLTEAKRLAVPGMARMYQELLDTHPGAPIFYLSTGAWNTYPFLTRFLARHRFPTGPMLLTDWGPTNTGWFRSGPAHKRHALMRLRSDFPNISWVLIGDDGQHDPEIYAEFAAEHPKSVQAIAIRQLSPVEQVLSHGSTSALVKTTTAAIGDVPIFGSPDGRGLLAKLRVVSAKKG